MNFENANSSIECTVNNCKHHCAEQNYCTLPRILIGTHETNPTACECTDCKNFECI